MQIKELFFNVQCWFFSLFIVGVILICPCDSIRCYQCGEYTDGVGSITPCINYTDVKHLFACADEKSYCVKYEMEASTVRGCTINCEEKEKWGTKIYCCNEDACNSASLLSYNYVLLLIPYILLRLPIQNNRSLSFAISIIH